jgi:hypothetical protein
MHMKFFSLALASVLCFTTARAAVTCQQGNADCDLYFDSTGSLVDRGTGNVIAKDIRNVGMLSDVAVFRYGNQYVLVQENHSSDRLVTAIPLARENQKWVSTSVYYFSISSTSSSEKQGPRWVARKIDAHQVAVRDDILDWAANLASDRRFNSLLPAGWPSTKLYVATSRGNPKGVECFVPFRFQGSVMPIDLLACRSLILPVSDGRYDFSGMIGKDLPVEISLSKKGHSINGEYRYLRYPNSLIRVEGTVTEDGELSMSEFAKKGGPVTGYFRGVIESGIISGEWNSADNARQLPFSLYVQGFPQ